MASRKKQLDTSRGLFTTKKILVVLFLFLFAPLSCKAASPDSRHFKEDVFSLEIPADWQRLEEEGLAEFHSHYEKEGKKLYQQRYSGADDNDTKVPFLCVFHGPNMEATLTLVRMKIPPQAKNYLDQILAQSKDTIEWGIQQGIVKRSFASKLVKLGQRDALYTNIETADGDRLIAYALFLPDHPYQILNILFTIDAGTMAKYRKVVEHIPATLKINIEREIKIKGAKYRLSAEAQKFLMVSGESGYPADTQALIINEPHYDSEGQWNLYKGLETFVNDNPGMAARLIFLAEGATASEPVSVAPLTDSVPSPSDQIIRAVLDSYLITGYIAYEWRHRNGIQIIGTEEEKLYKESATRWVSMDKSWPLTVVARNQRMVGTLLEHWKGNKIPVLFVGGMHLNPIDDEEFETGKQNLGGISDPSIAKSLKETKNIGVLDLLRQRRIGYITLEPASKLLFAEHQGPSEKYSELFRAQISGDYDQYVEQFFLDSFTRVANASIGLKEDSQNHGVTIRSTPKEAARLSKRYDKMIKFIRDFFGPDFLGSDPTARTNERGDLILLSKDFIKKLMFHVKKFAPHDAPHIQVEDHGKGVGRRMYFDENLTEEDFRLES